MLGQLIRDGVVVGIVDDDFRIKRDCFSKAEILAKWIDLVESIKKSDHVLIEASINCGVYMLEFK